MLQATTFPGLTPNIRIHLNIVYLSIESELTVIHSVSFGPPKLFCLLQNFAVSLLYIVFITKSNENEIARFLYKSLLLG